MGTLIQGAKQAVINCMKITSKDRVVIVGDIHSENIINALNDESCNVTNDVITFSLENYGRRPLKKLPEEILNAVKKSTAVFYTAKSYPREKEALRKPIIKEGTKHGREAHMPDITEQLMKEGMCADYKEIKKISKKVYDIVSKAKEIRVITEKGTNLVAEFDRKIKWIICDGDITKSKMGWSNLPDGEVFTCVKNISGTAVIDGSLGDYFGEYGIMDKTPIIVEIKNDYVISLKCENKKLEKELNQYMKQDKNASRIGEFALGTNLGLEKLTGNLLQDEKFPGVHIAIGNGYPNETGSGWDSKAHCDLIMQKTTVFADGRKIMDKGKYII